MDGMSYFGKDLTGADALKAAEPRGVGNALITLVVTIVVTIGSVLALDWAGISLPVAYEFQPMPIPGQ